MQAKHNSGKVLLALDVSPRSMAALEVAVSLAAELGVDLAGLFVEDDDLLRLSRLTFTREIGLLSPISRPIDFVEMEKALRREEDEVQRRLAEAANAFGVRWSFQVARGRIATELFALADKVDFVVLGKRARFGVQPSDEYMAGAPKAAKRPVMVVFDGSDAARLGLVLASRLVSTSCTGLRLLVPAASRKEFLRLVEEARSLFGNSGNAEISFQQIPHKNKEKLAVAVKEAGARVLFIYGDGYYRSGEGFATLLNEIACPVILAG